MKWRPSRILSALMSMVFISGMLSPTAFAVSKDLELQGKLESGEVIQKEDGSYWELQTKQHDVEFNDTYEYSEGAYQAQTLEGDSSFNFNMGDAVVNGDMDWNVQLLADIGVDGSASDTSNVTSNNRPGVWDNAVGLNYHNGWMWKSFKCDACNGGSNRPICDTHFLIDVKLDNSMKERVYIDKTCVKMWVVYKDSRRQQKYVPWAWSLTKTTSANWTPKSAANRVGWPTAWNTHDSPDNVHALDTGPGGYTWPINDSWYGPYVKAWLVYKQGVDLAASANSEWWVTNSGNKVDVIWLTKTDIEPPDVPLEPEVTGDRVESILKAFDDQGLANFSDPVKGITVDQYHPDHPNGGHPVSNQNYGYAGENHCYSTAGAFEESRPNEVVPFHSDDPEVMGSGNYDIYTNPVKKLYWHWDTPNGAETFLNKITIVTHYIVRTEHHCEHCCSHCCDLICIPFAGCYCSHGSSHDHYNRQPGNVYTRTWEYNAQPPQLKYMIFNPINLNRNGPCEPIDYRNETEFRVNFPNIPLSLDVNNKQNISGGVDDVTDDSNHIRMLDTNEAIPWDINIKNDQLGIPTEAEGGFTMYDSEMDFWFAMNRDRWQEVLGTISTESSELTAAGLGGQSPTVQDVSYIVHYEPELYGQYNIALEKIFTVSEDGGAEADTKTWTIERDRSYTGEHNFTNRAIFYGDKYALMGQMSDFWEVWYKEVQYYTYGLCMAGYIDIDDPIPIRHTHICQLLYESATYNEHVLQPWLRANFVVKTVGGNVG